MIAKPDFIRVTGLVTVNGYVGRIIDVAESDTSLMVKVESAKCARRFQKPDWLDYTAAPDLWSPATLQDLLEDAEREKQAALKSIEAVERSDQRRSKFRRKAVWAARSTVYNSRVRIENRLAGGTT